MYRQCDRRNGARVSLGMPQRQPGDCVFATARGGIRLLPVTRQEATGEPRARTNRLRQPAYVALTPKMQLFNGRRVAIGTSPKGAQEKPKTREGVDYHRRCARLVASTNAASCCLRDKIGSGCITGSPKKVRSVSLADAASFPSIETDGAAKRKWLAMTIASIGNPKCA
jgi:hypothetical protein